MALPPGAARRIFVSVAMFQAGRPAASLYVSVCNYRWVMKTESVGRGPGRSI